jgi:hypothetical protein
MTTPLATQRLTLRQPLHVNLVAAWPQEELALLKSVTGLVQPLDASFGVHVEIQGEFTGEVESLADGSRILRLQRSRESKREVHFQLRAQTPAAPAIRTLLDGLLGSLPNAAAPILDRLAGTIEQRVPKALEAKLSGLWRRDVGSADTYEFRLDAGAGIEPVLDAIGRGEWPAALGSSFHTLSKLETVDLEILLPFVPRRHWHKRLQVLGEAQVQVTESGRITLLSLAAQDAVAAFTQQSSLTLLAGLAGAARRFDFQFEGQWRLSRKAFENRLMPILECYGALDQGQQWLAAQTGEIVEPTLTLNVPGEAVDCWLDLPEAYPAFTASMLPMARAVQAAMRRWLPLLYFQDLRRYENLSAALPLLVYAATAPRRATGLGNLTYDPSTPEGLHLAINTAGRNKLIAALRAAHQDLTDAGFHRLAPFYEPARWRDIVQESLQQQRLLNALFLGDAILIDRLVDLAEEARHLRRKFARAPQSALSNAAKAAEQITFTFHRRLERLYAGRDFRALGPLLFAEATKALSNQRFQPQVTIL